MSDYELLTVVLMILGIIVSILIAYTTLQLYK